MDLLKVCAVLFVGIFQYGTCDNEYVVSCLSGCGLKTISIAGWGNTIYQCCIHCAEAPRQVGEKVCDQTTCRYNLECSPSCYYHVGENLDLDELNGGVCGASCGSVGCGKSWLWTSFFRKRRSLTRSHRAIVKRSGDTVVKCCQCPTGEIAHVQQETLSFTETGTGPGNCICEKPRPTPPPSTYVCTSATTGQWLTPSTPAPPTGCFMNTPFNLRP